MPETVASEMRVRLEAVERDVTHTEQQINVIRDTMATRSDIASILTKIEQLSAQQTASTKPNYSLLVSIVGVAMVFLTMIGGFAYWPINAATSDLKVAVISLGEKIVPQKQYEADQSRMSILLAGLRSGLDQSISNTIQQQRYNTDQDRLNHILDDMRIRSFDLHGRMARTEETVHSLDARYDAVSRRLAEFIRDSGKH